MMKKKKKKSVPKRQEVGVGVFFLLDDGNICGMSSDGLLQIVSPTDNETELQPIPINPDYR